MELHLNTPQRHLQQLQVIPRCSIVHNGVADSNSKQNACCSNDGIKEPDMVVSVEPHEVKATKEYQGQALQL